MDNSVYGRPPTPEEQQLHGWAVAQRIDDYRRRVDDYVKSLLSTITLVGTVLTGLGVITGAALVQQQALRAIVAAPVACAVASALLALAALRAGASSVVSTDNLTELSNWITKYVWRRARTARMAGTLLAFALILATAAALAVLAHAERPELTPSTAVINGGRHPKLLVQLSGNNLAPASLVTAEVVATYKDGEKQLVGYQVAAVKRAGTVGMNLDIAQARADLRLVNVMVVNAQRRCNVQVDLGGDRVDRININRFRCNA